MADSDDFESSEGTSDTSVSYKYCQVVVPNYQFDVTSSGASAPTFTPDGSEEGTRLLSGSSFLRLGSFPDLSATSPSGLSNSVTLAKLVGNTDGLAELDSKQDEAPDSSGILRSTDAYQGDEYHLLGFVDDSRYRNPEEKAYIAGQSCDDTTSARKTETKRLLSKGGWWDHSDGNRVTTTSGDKVEVIQGNYKLVVLGRKDPAEGGAELGEKVTIHDTSGGNRIQVGGQPEILCVEYAEDDGVWSVVEKAEANSTAIFHGKKVEYFTGPVKQEYIGKDPGDFDAGDDIDKKHDKENDPDITAKIWAKSISEYKGSAGKPIETIFELTHAKAITETKFAAAINVVEIAAEITETRTGLWVETTVGLNVELATVKLEILGAKIEFVGRKDVIAEEEDEITMLENQLKGIVDTIRLSEQNVMAQHNKLVGKVSELNGSLTTLNGDFTNMCGVSTHLAGAMLDLTVEMESIAAVHQLM